jgi:hypothetical protein
MANQPSNPVAGQPQQTAAQQVSDYQQQMMQHGAHMGLYYPGQQGVATGMTVLLFSPIGTHKTTWAATWPSPIFLSCGSEGGDDSLGVVPHIWPNIPIPPTIKIDSANRMKQAALWVVQNAAHFGWKTIVIDSLTYYVDTWIQDLITLRYGEQKRRGRTKAIDDFQSRMTQADWGLLEYHIMKELVTLFHNSGLNVIWTALVKEKMADDGRGNQYVKEYMPDVVGAAGRKLPGVCKLVLFGQHENTMVATPDGGSQMTMQPKFYTSPPNPKVQMVRHRYGPTVFPYGCLWDEQFGSLPTFEAVRSQIGQYIVQ